MEETITPIKKRPIILLAIIFIIIGAGLFAASIYFGYTNGFMTDEQCSNLTILAYQHGIIDVANFTTVTGNFTYIFDNIIETKGVQDYCIEMIQFQNQG